MEFSIIFNYPMVLLLYYSIITVIVTEIIKKRTKRNRPYLGITRKRKFHIRERYINFSFPSGDSAQAGAILLYLSYYLNNNIYIILLLMAMLGRIYFGCHYVLDTIFGASIGIIITYLYHTFCMNYLIEFFDSFKQFNY